MDIFYSIVGRVVVSKLDTCKALKVDFQKFISRLWPFCHGMTSTTKKDLKLERENKLSNCQFFFLPFTNFLIGPWHDTTLE